MRSIYCAIIISLLVSGLNGIPMGTISGAADSKIDSNNNHKSEHTAEDDSDMLMEPDAIHPHILASSASPSDTEPVESLPSAPADTNESAAQNFYPYYRDTSSLGQGRQFYSFSQQANEYQAPVQPNYNQGRSHDSSAAVLGSGDFGVIRGGTFYQDNDPPTRNLEADYFNYYSNGHGRPHSPYYVAKYNYPDDQFANFRDFADINTPGDPAYSEFVVVYANKNSTLAKGSTGNSSTSVSKHPVKTNPKNIFEQLELLDKEKKEAANKLSKTKLKLKNTKLEKKYQKSKLTSSTKDDTKMPTTTVEVEPLLALS